MLPAEVIQAIVTAVAALIAWWLGRKFPAPVVPPVAPTPVPVVPVTPVPAPILPVLPGILDWIIRNAPDLLKLIRLIPMQVVVDESVQKPATVYGDVRADDKGGYEVPLTLVVRVPVPTVETFVSPK